MTKSRFCFLLIYCAIFSLSVAAQKTDKPILLPQPQEFIKDNNTVVAEKIIIHRGENLDDDATALLQKTLPIVKNGKGLPLTLSLRPKAVAPMNRSGAYSLTISNKGIRIEAMDNRGLYYAVQTLSKLTTPQNEGGITLPACRIKDYPDVLYRGTVEGFYGVPWSFEDRIAQLRFYGLMKMNTYIYGPKDDPYHSSPHWRDAYPEKEANQIRALVKEANHNKVDFVWAIHPGKDIQWNKTDSSAIIDKFEKMYDLGVRSFAVFFDDISGEGTKPEKQAGLLNYIHREFVEKKADVTPLIMCPTEYNKAWSNPKEGTYLDILGEQLLPGIEIMWTGNSVISDITREGLEWVNRRLKRPAYVWWNFPVSDYVRDHLLMGPAYGLENNIAQEMSGFVSNPMDKAEASKVGIFGVALYTWNMDGYNPNEAWKQACEFIMPEAPQAFMTFCTHNSDPGFNYHRYRRDESINEQPLIDAFISEFKSGTLNNKNADELKQLFHTIQATPNVMKTKSKNRRLIEQLTPWLIQFERLGSAGVEALEAAKQQSQSNTTMAWYHFRKANIAQDSMLKIDKTMNINPYQPGVKTGSKALAPFVNELTKVIAGNFLSGKLSAQKYNLVAIASLYTNQEKLVNMPPRQKENSIGYTPIFEVIKLEPGQYIGVQWEMQKTAKQFEFNLPYSNKAWRVMEWSADGTTWSQIDNITTEMAKGKIENIDTTARYIRMRNSSNEPHEIYLSGFTVNTIDIEQIDETKKMYDRNFTTSLTLLAGKTLEISCDNKSTIELFVDGVQKNSTKDCPIVIETINKYNEKKTIYFAQAGYVCINKNILSDAEKIIITPCGDSDLQIYEIVKR